MARKFIDGFESGDHDMWDDESNATVVSSTGLDMDGDYCLDLLAINEYLEKNITAVSEMYFAFLIRTTSNTIATLSFWNSTNRIARVVRVGGVLKAYVGGSSVEDGTIACNADTSYLIEIYLKIADVGGRFVVKIDGITDINFTGDTKFSTYSQFDKIRFGYDGSSSSYAYFDNFIMDDANWIGNTKIQAVVPTGAGNSTGWTPSVGNNWECVDEKPPNDADYVGINVNDIVDTYAAGNMIGTIDSVKCVQVQSRTRTEGTPIPTNLKLVVRSGGTDYLSGDKAVPAVEKSLWSLWENNPADSLAWEEADVNAMEIGIKSAA